MPTPLRWISLRFHRISINLSTFLRISEIFSEVEGSGEALSPYFCKFYINFWLVNKRRLNSILDFSMARRHDDWENHPVKSVKSRNRQKVEVFFPHCIGFRFVIDFQNSGIEILIFWLRPPRDAPLTTLVA